MPFGKKDGPKEGQVDFDHGPASKGGGGPIHLISEYVTKKSPSAVGRDMVGAKTELASALGDRWVFRERIDIQRETEKNC